MPNYQDGKIYTIRNYTDNEMIYVGSTTQTLSRRLAKHRTDCKCGISRISLYSHIVDNDWSNWYIELYEYYPCNNKTELEKREGEIIREIGTLNKYIAGRTKEEWREENTEYFKEYGKIYREENTDKIKEYKKKYGEENADKIKEYKKKYYEENADKIKERKKIQICCNICGAFSLKQHLARHQKTKKCMSALN
jgi:hypothetical protein